MIKRRFEISIRKKLLLSFFTIAAFILVVGSLGIYNVQKVYNNGDKIYDNNLKAVEYLKSIHQNTKEIDQNVIGMMSDLDEKYHTVYKETIESMQQENQDLLEKYSKLEITKLEERRYNQCRLSILSFDKQINSIVELLDRKERDVALIQYEQELMPIKACTYELVEAIVELSTENARIKNEENRQVYMGLVAISGIVMVLTIVIAIIITLSVSSNFTGKLRRIQTIANSFSEYDMSLAIEDIGNDEFGETMAVLNESQFMLRDLLEKIIEESATIDDVGDEVAQAVRKSNLKIEAVNVDVYRTEDMAEEVEFMVKDALENKNLDTDMKALLLEILRRCTSSKDNLQEIQFELSGIATYLEQIGITADYQNKLASQHMEQVKKFKV